MQVIKRNSSIELLKIVAVFLIVLSHSLPVNNSEAEWYINIKSATSNVSYISMLFFSYCGQIGNEIFFICSAWFLVDYYNRGGRIKFDKIKNIVIETVFVSYLYLFITTVVLKQHVSGFMILESLLPISTEHYWFITAYLFFNIFCPILHMYLINCERKQQRKVCMFIIILYMIAGNLIPLQGDLYFCNKVIMFLGLYACVFYIKETKMNFSKPVLGIGILLIGIILVIANFV